MTLRRTPLAAALFSIGTVSLAVSLPAWAQTAAPSGTETAPQKAPSAAPATASQATPHDTGALPTVQVNDAVDKNTFQVETSTVGAKAPTALRDIPQAVTVIDRALIDSQGVTSFQDALRNAPGVTIGGAEGGSIGNNVNLRGFSARTDIYLDGFRDRGQYYRDTFDLEAIEVLYGPSSMLFGRGSTGGVINQVSKQAQLAPVSEVSAQVGTNDRYRTTVDIDRALSDTAAFRINAFGQSVGSTRDEMRNKDYGVAPTVKFGIGTPTTVTLSALIQHNRDMPDYGVPPVNGHPAPVDKGTFYGLTDDRTIQDVQIVSARIDHRFSDSLQLRNQTQYSHYVTDARETGPSAVLTGPLPTSTALTHGNFTTLPLSSLFVRIGSHDRVISDQSLYNNTDLISKFVTGPLHHELITGVELGHDSYSNQATSRSNLPITPLLDPIYTSTPANSTTTIGNYANAGANSLAAYANDTISIGEHWKVVAGLRWDRYQAHILNTISLPGYASQTNNYTSVRTGVIWQPTEEQSYYASYGTSFNPSLETLTVTNGQQNLPPESNRSYEIGGKWDVLDGNLSINSSLFQINKTNARTAVSTGVYELDGNIRVNGFQTGASGRITKNWLVFAGYTYLDAEIVEAADGTQGNTPANVPRNTVTLWTTYQPLQHWEIGGGVNYMSSRYVANNNLVSVGGFARWDATVAYLQKKYDLRLNLLNLTNKYYYDSLIPSDGGRAVPAIGRTVLLTGTYRF
ncbi:TonB-dependent receptor [Pararobbsia alpina]|uniref:Putative TonB-dependent receptor BfrD n=1 Tax=Pararobbsia alpina TaxID=621374 RepID=A0A6S7AV46_9BURK|nr:TonB-dependent siderophore receptor [Pararobbsia alpina]CAB3778737.1 putative TonB-dependent receptor BfrD [Pararobbsia alpina]